MYLLPNAKGIIRYNKIRKTGDIMNTGFVAGSFIGCVIGSIISYFAFNLSMPLTILLCVGSFLIAIGGNWILTKKGVIHS